MPVRPRARALPLPWAGSRTAPKTKPRLITPLAAGTHPILSPLGIDGYFVDEPVRTSAYWYALACARCVSLAISRHAATASHLLKRKCCSAPPAPLTPRRRRRRAAAARRQRASGDAAPARARHPEHRDEAVPRRRARPPGALRDAAAAGLDGPAAASPAAACLDASVTEASGDAPRAPRRPARRARGGAGRRRRPRRSGSRARPATPRRSRGAPCRARARRRGGPAPAPPRARSRPSRPSRPAARRGAAARGRGGAARGGPAGGLRRRRRGARRGDAAFVDDRAEGLSAGPRGGAEGAALPVGEAIADAHDVLVRGRGPRRGRAGRWKARRRRGLVRRARKDAARHLDRNARDRLDVPAKARNAAHWAEPDREVAPPPRR